MDQPILLVGSLLVCSTNGWSIGDAKGTVPIRFAPFDVLDVGCVGLVVIIRRFDVSLSLHTSGLWHGVNMPQNLHVTFSNLSNSIFEFMHLLLIYILANLLGCC
jgi:hypothetical protein